jgi:hypothetical protein
MEGKKEVDKAVGYGFPIQDNKGVERLVECVFDGGFKSLRGCLKLMHHECRKDSGGGCSFGLLDILNENLRRGDLPGVDIFVYHQEKFPNSLSTQCLSESVGVSSVIPIVACFLQALQATRNVGVV